jgi:hypothetical protein
MSDVAEIAKGLTTKAGDFLVSVVPEAGQMWQTEEGQRVPSSLVSHKLIDRIPTNMGNFYTLTFRGVAVRAHLQEASHD